ncbi:MAG: hypothetical protein ACKVHR_01550 [Pirellulales bacterium]|jgi:hypothetical protein
MAGEPKDLLVIKKDSKLCAALIAFMTRTQSVENVMFFFNKGNAAALYPKYIADSAKTQVNLPGKIKQLADKLSSNFDDKAWAALLTLAKKDIKKLVEADVLPRFYKSKEYYDYAKKNKMGDPKKAAKLLGINNVKLLTEAMGQLACGNKAQGTKLLKKLIKEEKMKESADRMVEALEKSMLF